MDYIAVVVKHRGVGNRHRNVFVNKYTMFHTLIFDLLEPFSKGNKRAARELACERRPISGCRLSSPKNTDCELEPRNDFRDFKV